jgi:hypothetical protein
MRNWTSILIDPIRVVDTELKDLDRKYRDSAHYSPRIYSARKDSQLKLKLLLMLYFMFPPPDKNLIEVREKLSGILRDRME